MMASRDGEANNLDYEEEYELQELHEEIEHTAPMSNLEIRTIIERKHEPQVYELESAPEPKISYKPEPAYAKCPATLLYETHFDMPEHDASRQGNYDNVQVHIELERAVCPATLIEHEKSDIDYTSAGLSAIHIEEPIVRCIYRDTDSVYFAAVKRGHQCNDSFERLKDLYTRFGYSTHEVNKQGEDNWSALQLAAALGDEDIVKELCKYKNINLVQKDDEGDTPLHTAACLDNGEVIEIILNTAENPDRVRDAINMSNKAKETPFTIAATRVHIKPCAMMIRYSPPLDYTFHFVHPRRNPGSQGIEKDSGIFGKLRTEKAVKNFEKMNEHIIRYHKRNGQGKTAINIMITKMPDLVFEILDKSIFTIKTVSNKKENIQRVIIDFGALEYYGDKKQKGIKIKTKKEYIEMRVEEEKKKTKKEEEEEKKEEEETGNPLTSGYYKNGSNPLQIIAKMNRSLLTHPVVEALIVTKWGNIASTYFYIFTFLLYLIFFYVLMRYQYTQIKPFVLLENDKAVRSWIENSSHTCDEFPDGCSKKKSAECDIFGYMVMVMSAIRLFLELLDLLDNVFNLDDVFNGSDPESGSKSPLETGRAWLQGLMSYLIDAENWLEVILYSSCLFFSLNVLEPQSVMSPFQWKIGALAVLTSFINLLLLLQLFPHIGIYIIIFFKIAWTFVSKILSLLAFFLIAFMVVFHMLLSHTNVFRKILSPDAIFKTLSAGVSGIEYDDYADQEMIYPTTTLVGLIAFALFVQVLFLNLATALAIDDVVAIQKGAEKAIYALKIKHIYNAERIANLIQWVAKPIFCESALNFLKHQKRFQNMPAKRFTEDHLKYIAARINKYNDLNLLFSDFYESLVDLQVPH